MPRIAITTRRVPADGELVHFIGVRYPYAECLRRVGAVPLLIPLLEKGAWSDELLECCDGLLITGGEDVTPLLYGEVPHERLKRTSLERDELEMQLIREALRLRMPLLAICRGMQILNVAMGGTLFQDLPAQRQSAEDHADGDTDADWTEFKHSISIESGSKLRMILGCGSTEVNSLHHQALKTVARDLRVAAKAPDGLVEAVEITGYPFGIGVQLHPETLAIELSRGESAAAPDWIKIFAAFAEAASEFRLSANRCAQ